MRVSMQFYEIPWISGKKYLIKFIIMVFFFFNACADITSKQIQN